MAERGDRSRRAHRSRRRFLATTGALGAGLVAGCLSSNDAPAAATDGATQGTDGDSADESAMAWRTTELTDVLTEESFSIEGLASTGPVAVQSFAVWCPKCERQSQELANVGDSVTVVGLNIDPNEDAAKVRQHAEANGFDWRFAVAPPDMTESLVAQFGPTVTNAPSTPIIVACETGVAEFFAGSQQSVEDIRSAAENC